MCASLADSLFDAVGTCQAKEERHSPATPIVWLPDLVQRSSFLEVRFLDPVLLIIPPDLHRIRDLLGKNQFA